MAGLGDRATGLMSMLFGGDEETTPEGGGGNGVGNIMTNVSNQMFNGMSQEQVYRMGQSFNTLRFEPDDRMAANFESRIAQIQSDKKTTAKTNATIDFLKKNKRDDLAQMVESGIYTPAKAVDLAMTVTKDPEWLAQIEVCATNDDRWEEKRWNGYRLRIFLNIYMAY